MKKKLTIFFIFVLVFFLMGKETPVFCTENNGAKIEQKRTHAKNQIKKLKLLERIETGKLYNNQKKLEKTEKLLQKELKNKSLCI